jgi:hypothetical protein
MAQADRKRRWFGAMVLATDLLMLIIGQTLLKDRLSGVGFVLYWMICFILTGIAIFVALVDARVLQYRTRREHRELVQNTLEEIDTEAKTKPRRDGD